ncbi:MAG: DUF5719 family protein [Propionibacteriaceae bacterium]|jgi:hypothetical protein|nr:DUF5719 family protein [Propionibacteriaceae bacterium]
MMIPRVGFIGGIVVILGALVTAILVPIPQPAVRQIALPVSRLLACPVGVVNLGETVVKVTDTEVFRVGLVNALPSEPTTSASVENPAKPVVVRGSATVGGIASYTEVGKIMMAPCASPITTGTWNGVETQGMDSALIFSNIDSTPAVVDVFIFGQTGPIALPGLRDIPVAAGYEQVLSINQLLSSETPISIQVRASKGRVSAILRSINDQGADWQHPQALADTDLVMVGIPGGSGTRTLSLTNPDSSAQATVTVGIIGEMGPFTPHGLETIEIPPSRSISVDMTQALGGQPSGIHLSSDLPVTASITVADRDIAGLSSQPALHGEVVLPPIGGILWVANPGLEEATVSLHSMTESGTGLVIETPIPAQSLVPIEFPSTGISVRIATTSDSLRTSLTLTDKAWSILPIYGGGIISSVDVPQLDPGLG